MAEAILVDTDVLVDFLRGDPRAADFVNACADRILLSAIVVAELYAGVKGEKEMAVLDKFISLFPVVPISSHVARAAGLFKRSYGRSHGVGLADAIVAATAQAENAELKTFNTKHYPMLENAAPPYDKQARNGQEDRQ